MSTVFSFLGMDAHPNYMTFTYPAGWNAAGKYPAGQRIPTEEVQARLAAAETTCGINPGRWHQHVERLYMHVRKELCDAQDKKDAERIAKATHDPVEAREAARIVECGKFGRPTDANSSFRVVINLKFAGGKFTNVIELIVAVKTPMEDTTISTGVFI
jgi:hypothetical protein